MLSSWDLLPKIFGERLGKFVSMCAEEASADKIDSIHGPYTPRTYTSLRYHVFASTISSESLLQVQPSHAMYPHKILPCTVFTVHKLSTAILQLTRYDFANYSDDFAGPLATGSELLFAVAH